MKYHIEFSCRSWNGGLLIETFEADNCEDAINQVKRKYSHGYGGFSVEPRCLTDDEYADLIKNAGPPIG